MTFLSATLVGIVGVAGAAGLRILIGPTVWDRLLGLGLISSKVITAIVVTAVMVDRSYLLDVAIVYSLIGFLSSVLIARFVERRSRS